MSDEVTSNPATPAATFESTSVHDAPVHRIQSHRNAAAKTASTRAFAELMAKGGAGVQTDDDDDAPAVATPSAPPPSMPPEPADEPIPAYVDVDALRLRRELAAQRDDEQAPTGPSFDDLLDQPGQTLRGWIEGLRGEKFADDSEFRAEASDFVSRVASDVLGVPLPAHVRAKLDAAAAKKSLKHMKASDAKRETTARERSEREAHEEQWNRAADAVDHRLVEGSEAAKAYPWLASEDRPGQIVIDVIRRANEEGETLTFDAAAKHANNFLKNRHSKRAALANAKPAAPVRAETPPAAPPPSTKKWTRDDHRDGTLEAFRKIRKDR